jgi:hypothetical protein
VRQTVKKATGMSLSAAAFFATQSFTGWCQLPARTPLPTMTAS